MQSRRPLDDFHPFVRGWFGRTFSAPSPPQVLGWPSISQGKHTLILAPTGSGKTLAAFLWAINHLVEQHLHEDLPPGVRILYVSPLKALNNDIERNLEVPLSGIREEARTAKTKLPAIRTAVRTGDTPQSRRMSMLKHPPDILITTPESLYLMLTSKQARKMFKTVQYVIVDEIHSICGNKRGVHLSISLERLAALADQEFTRIGLSATQRPLEEIAAFLGGQVWKGKKLVQRPVNIVDAGRKKHMDLRVECAVQDFTLLPQESVWPLVFDELLTMIREHTTTLVFVNNRRLAERIAAKLNEMITGNEDTFNMYAVPRMLGLAPPRSARDSTTLSERSPEFVRAYHGSMSRHAREQMEAELKAGRLRALVATSSLELGIDIGSIDLVVQIGSPKGVARGLQRVGRSGHLITATSKGRIYPTHREDLVESAVVARSMTEHDVEATSIPKDSLDVLAQQIVAMVSVEEWGVDDLFDLVRQSYCYRNLSRKLYNGVLQMLGGRYTNEMFRELRARVSWDKVNNTLRALPGSSQLAITSGGTIADRGYFGVYLEDGKTKVGEVDEEFVYESRAGDTFILGTSIWRILNIDANRLSVAPAPGQPARMPFWRGEGIGRSYELGTQVGIFRKDMSRRIDTPDCLKWLQSEFPIDSRAAWNIQEYFRKQRDVCGAVPHDELILIEGFRDEIGDPRLVVHSCFGRRVNGLLGLLLSHRLQEAVGVEPQMLYNDNGILLRCSDVDELPLELLDDLTMKEAEELVLDELLSSPLFGGQFRMNAARALLMPKTAPGKRTPLWLQRLRAGDLLQIARQYDDFPIVIETIREVLNDVLDFEHFKQIIRGIEDGTIRTRSVQTEVPSPFAASLLFDFIAVYMYEWDQPRADKLSQYLSINREILSEIVDLESIRTMLRPEAIAMVERQLQRIEEGYKARSPEELLEVLLRIGDLSEEEIALRVLNGDLSLLRNLAENGRAVPIDFASGTRWVAGEEAAIYSNLNAQKHLRHVLRRYVQSHGPVAPAELSSRYGIDQGSIRTVFDTLVSEEEIVSGSFRPEDNSGERQWCYRPNLERIHRQTISVLRKEIKPSTIAEFTHFLFHWQHLYPHTQESGAAGLQTCLSQLQGIPLPSEIWEREILSRRIKNYSPEGLSQFSSSGTMVWVGAGQGKMLAVFRGEGNMFLGSPGNDNGTPESEQANRILSYLRANGASFFTDIRTGTQLSLSALNRGIAELFWSGQITNDLFSELLGVKRTSKAAADAPIERIEMLDPRHNPAKARMMQRVRKAIKQVPGWNGRWSLVDLPGVTGENISIEEKVARQATQLLERYGILAREFYRREEMLPWDLIATELQRMEMRGEIRRGYFVEGLSGMQFALPTAVEELRRLRSGSEPSTPPQIVNACDPANPYGTGINLTANESRLDGVRFARVPGNYLICQRGTPILMIENYGSRLWTIGETDVENLRESLRSFTTMMRLPGRMRPFRAITVEHCDGVRPAQGPMEPILRSLGFHKDRNQTMLYDGF